MGSPNAIDVERASRRDIRPLEILIVNLWRHIGFIYANWIMIIYEATPYDINQINPPD